MSASELLSLLQAEFGPAIVSVHPDFPDPTAVVDPAKLVEICTFLRDDPRTRFALLNNLSGSDFLETDPKKAPKAGFEPHLEVIYHLSSFEVPGRRLAIKVLLPRWKASQVGELPELPTVSGIWRTADWHEREVYDLLGIHFLGHPDLRRILLNDDWVGHPLRKDYEFPLEYHDIRCR